MDFESMLKNLGAQLDNTLEAKEAEIINLTVAQSNMEQKFYKISGLLQQIIDIINS